MSKKTPVSYAGERIYDHLPAREAVLRAWTVPGSNPTWHESARREVAGVMPLLARALDRLAREVGSV